MSQALGSVLLTALSLANINMRQIASTTFYRSLHHRTDQESGFWPHIIIFPNILAFHFPRVVLILHSVCAVKCQGGLKIAYNLARVYDSSMEKMKALQLVKEDS